MNISEIHGLSVLLRSMPILSLLQNPIEPKELINSRPYVLKLYKEEFFKRACLREYPSYSENEVVNIYSRLNMQIKKQRETGNYGIFSLILSLAEQVLSTEGKTILCRHEEIVNWREAVHGIGQQIFICAYFAWQDVKKRFMRTNFDFNPYVKSDNIRLRNMLSQGMAENHFHLKGSSPVFLLSWVCLMNHVTNRKQEFESIQMNRSFFSKEDEDKEFSLYDLVMKAAAIRLYLTRVLSDRNSKNEYETDMIFNIKSPLDQVVALQTQINIQRFMYPKSLDYIVDTNNMSGAYSSVMGENTFLYRVFYAIFSNDDRIMRHIDLVYAYILIFTKTRREIIQSNNAVGFHNFKLYEERKEIFIDKYKRYSEALITMAHCSVLDNQSMKSLEARITPKKSTSAINKSMRHTLKLNNNQCFARCSSCEHFDVLTNKCGTQQGYCKKYLERTQYVFHIVKQPDKIVKDKMIGRQRYRHYKYIHEVVEPTVNAILEWRKAANETAKFVYGIDACNNEIGCRPEVFAPYFRKVRIAEVGNTSKRLLEIDIPILRITYHVGEDFLDIADGLRAIEEVIRFLQLRSGDRLGHAIALGIDAKEWYSFKGNRIILPRQDLLDNAVWLYMKLHKTGVSGHELLHELREIFRVNYNYIYRSFTPFTEHDHDITIESYYDSWQLRGDHPKYYLNYEQQAFLKGIRFVKNGELLSGFGLEQIRQENWQARFMMHNYHYNLEAKERGTEITEYVVSSRYINAVKKIQDAMQREIARLGIAIETNPSSNYLISTFKRYDKHPIVAFNNQGLGSEEQSHQLFVSINTDDQGVFDTDLENEYALMANALENCVDTDGNYRYKPADVYGWLDNIRRMGLEQSFKGLNNFEKGD